MNQNKKEKQFKSQVYKLVNHIYIHIQGYEDSKKHLLEVRTYKHMAASYLERSESVVRVYELGFDLGYSEDEIKWIVFDTGMEKHKRGSIMRQIPQKEGRDNKGIYTGSNRGGSNRNKVRYPKKNRSKRVWKTFYKMFPHKAEIDNWDGETSDKMK